MKLIINATILCIDEQFTTYNNGFIAIENDKIIALGDGSYAHYSAQATEIFDAKGKIVSPGLVNTHVHTSQQMGRGLADDVDLLTWLRDRIWPYESTLTAEENYISALACCTEMIKSGVTTFLEAGGQHLPSMVKAVTESGMRASLAVSVTDTGVGLPNTWVKPADEWIDIQEEYISKYNHTNDDRIHVWTNIRTI
ncbi:MAG: amidohydrolase family protein, partial [Bacilli bacterium]